MRVDYPPKPEYRCPNRLRAGDQIVRPTSSGDGESFSRHHGIYLGSEQVGSVFSQRCDMMLE